MIAIRSHDNIISEGNRLYLYCEIKQTRDSSPGPAGMAQISSVQLKSLPSREKNRVAAFTSPTGDGLCPVLTQTVSSVV